jgi:hypothetical protein
MKDLCRVTGYTRHQVHGLVKLAIPNRSSRGERFAREFRFQDLIVVAALAELETRFGVKRGHIGKVAKRIAHVLSGPKKANRDARLVIGFDPPSVTYSDNAARVTDCIVMALGPIFDRADTYVLTPGIGARQESLRLGPTVLRAGAKRSSA